MQGYVVVVAAQRVDSLQFLPYRIRKNNVKVAFKQILTCLLLVHKTCKVPENYKY
uniref:Speckle-type POZ protein n=1 Tax=Solanum tuberosum TaxID=4113 RepID=M1BRY2_SOLTU